MICRKVSLRLGCRAGQLLKHCGQVRADKFRMIGRQDAKPGRLKIVVKCAADNNALVLSVRLTEQNHCNLDCECQR